MVNLGTLLRDIFFPSCPYTLMPDHEVHPREDPFPADIQTLIEHAERNQPERAARIRAWLSEYEQIQNGRQLHHDAPRRIIFNAPRLNISGTIQPRVNSLLPQDSLLRFEFFERDSAFNAQTRSEVFLENTPWYFPEGGLSLSRGRVHFDGALLWSLLSAFVFGDRLGPEAFQTEFAHHWLWWDLFMGRFLEAPHTIQEEDFVQSSALARLGRDFIHDRMSVSLSLYEIVDELLSGFRLPRDSSIMRIFGQGSQTASRPSATIQNVNVRVNGRLLDFFYDASGPERGAWLYLGAIDPVSRNPFTHLNQNIILNPDQAWRSFRLSGASHLQWALFRFPGGFNLGPGSLDISSIHDREILLTPHLSLDENSVGEDDLLSALSVSPGNEASLSTGIDISPGIRIQTGQTPGEFKLSANLNFEMTLRLFGVALRISGQLLANMHLIFEGGMIVFIPHDNVMNLRNFEIRGDHGSHIVSHGQVAIYDRSSSDHSTENEGLYFDFKSPEVQAHGLIPLLRIASTGRYDIPGSLNPFHLDLNTWFETEHQNVSANGSNHRPNFHFQLNSFFHRNDETGCHRNGSIHFISNDIPFHNFLRKIGVSRPLPPLMLYHGEADLNYDWNLRQNNFHRFSVEANPFNGIWNSLLLSVVDWLPIGLGGLRIAMGSRTDLLRRRLNLNSRFSVIGEADLNRQEFSGGLNLHASGSWFLSNTPEPLLRGLDLNMRLNNRGVVANLRSLWHTQALNPISAVPSDAPGYSLVAPTLTTSTYFPLNVSNHHFRWASSGRRGP